MPDIQPGSASSTRWAKLLDHTRCIGCHACSTACKSENEVPLGVHRTYVKQVDVGTFPHARRAFQVTRCNQCEQPPCVDACPTAAMHKRPDGIVDFDKSICIGCKACIASCPYDAIFINPYDGNAEKCNFCAHRIDQGMEPACVVVCPTNAIHVGDLSDPVDPVTRSVHRDPVTVRRPEKDTRPKVYYKGAHQATLDPLAAKRPEGGLFMWGEQGPVNSALSGHPDTPNSSAAAVLAWDIPHRAPWDARVSLYTWTKSLAAGIWLVAAMFVLFGALATDSSTWRWTVPVLSGVWLAATGGLLIWDLKRPERFWMIFAKPQWKSWLVRGAFIIAGFSAILGLHVLASLLQSNNMSRVLAWIGIPLAVMTAVYTAFLFAQAKARDLWQSPLLPPLLLVQAVLAGSAGLLPFVSDAEIAQGAGVSVVTVLRWTLAAACAAQLLLTVGEVTLTHSTAHAKLATHEMVQGRFRMFFWAGVILVGFGLFAPIAPVEYGALLGLLAFEHAYVQAGQSVPLA
ncbi:MAG: polysulfide reductase NrfD [Planctomycetes bacterium]|nr:polysulfide reductase NrfD [Planctomycetota bacterium]